MVRARSGSGPIPGTSGGRRREQEGPTRQDAKDAPCFLAYARCLESEEGKARRAVAAGLAEIAPQMERLWPHSSATEFGRGIVRALLLLESSPGIAGLLSAVVENLARVSLVKHDYTEFERILETLESAPRDDEHAHITTLVGRILNDDQWLYLVDEALANRPLSPVIPRLLRRCPDRLIDRLGLLLTAPNGMNSLPAMVRLIHGTGEPVLGALESRLYEPRRQRIATAIHLLASSDPKRLAARFPGRWQAGNGICKTWPSRNSRNGPIRRWWRRRPRRFWPRLRKRMRWSFPA